MALDRFITFKKLPEVLDVYRTIKSFFGKEWPEDVQWISDRYIISIPGTPFDPRYREERFIEVCAHGKSVDVMTRQADAIVNSIANGLATFLAHALDGKLEE